MAYTEAEQNLAKKLLSETINGLSEIRQQEVGEFEAKLFLMASLFPCRARQRDGYVYFAKNGSLVKIGYSTMPAVRVKALPKIQGKSAKLIHWIKGELKDEKALHQKFAHLRRDGEWFRYTNEIFNFIKESRNGQGVC